MYIQKKKLACIFVGLAVLLAGIIYFVYRTGSDRSLMFIPASSGMDLVTEPTAGNPPSDSTADDNMDAANQPTPSPRPEKIKVHIAGAVQNPGVYECEEGSRIIDLVEMAGGALPDADLDRVNLADYVEDAAQIRIPLIDETVDKIVTKSENGSTEQKDAEGKKLVNINTDSAEELKTLPGIGPVTAENILAYRRENGDFTAIEQIRNVPRIGDKTFEQLKDLICVD